MNLIENRREETSFGLISRRKLNFSPNVLIARVARSSEILPSPMLVGTRSVLDSIYT